jgi:hypothetical protein
MVLSTIDENLALFNNGNGDSVPATVPEREPHLDYDRRFILRLADGSKQKRSRPDPLLPYPGLGHEPKVAAIALREHMLPA